MCAAPGSKTAQLIEMVHSEEGCARPGNLKYCLFKDKYKNVVITL